LFGNEVLNIKVERESSTSIYPVGYVFNGRCFNEPWVLVEELEKGGDMTIRLSDRPSVIKAPIPSWLD
jgi:putative alpha-1,2-mannosidase